MSFALFINYFYKFFEKMAKEIVKIILENEFAILQKNVFFMKFQFCSHIYQISIENYEISAFEDVLEKMLRLF
jgi:hypothetical protein